MTIEQINKLIDDSIELAAEDITVAHRVIELQSELAVMIAKELKNAKFEIQMLKLQAQLRTMDRNL